MRKGGSKNAYRREFKRFSRISRKNFQMASTADDAMILAPREKAKVNFNHISRLI